MEKKIQAYIRRLFDAKRTSVSFDRNWPSQFPIDPGVYILFEKGKFVYVGETANIRQRMRQLRITHNHTVRRSIGRAQYRHRADFMMASSRKAFPDPIEKLLNEHMVSDITVCFLPIHFGRKEVEEYIIKTKKPKYNQR